MFNLCNFLKKTNNQNVNQNVNQKKEINDPIILNKNFENNECIICLDPMIINDKVQILNCGHMYHLDCINKWFNKKKEINCPLCSN
jgi:hypothetical protein